MTVTETSSATGCGFAADSLGAACVAAGVADRACGTVEETSVSFTIVDMSGAPAERFCCWPPRSPQ